jgi:hypothetical protein
MEVRKGTIKKPKFIPTYVVSVVIMLVVLFVLAFLLLLPEVAIYTSEAESSGSDYVNNLGDCFFNLMDKEEITAEDLNKVKAAAMNYYAATTKKCRITIDGYGEFDSSKTAVLAFNFWTDRNDPENTYRTYCLLLADNKYLEYFNIPEVMEYYRAVDNGDEYYPHGKELQFYCTEFYADLEKGTFIPVEVVICEDNGHSNFLPTGIKLKIEPDNTEGYTLYKSVDLHTDFEDNTANSVNFGYITGSDEPLTDEECDDLYEELTSGKGLHYVIKGQYPEYIPFTTAYKKELTIAVVVIIWLGFAFAFIPATISYNIKKRRFEIFEYRRKMIDAMAHDLKTPMAALAAYSENLSNNIATDKKEYYAGKIEEKVAQMNKMVNDILSFSKSESSSIVINKIELDVASVISGILADNEHAIAERSLTVNYDKKSVVIKTDKKLFEQAISNLINNAVLYSKEGTAIDIACDGDLLTITNVSAEKLEDVKSLKQAFSKGNLSRGSKGTGLGLAIADNNLAMLKYKLDVRSEGDKFIATVKM